MVGRLVAAVTALAVNTVVARLLDQDELAAYFLTFSVVVVAAAAARLGLPRVVVRFVSASIASGAPGQVRDVIRRVTFMSAIAGAITIVVLGGPPGQWLARSVFHSELMAGVMLLAGAWAACEALRYVQSEAFRGFHDFRQAALLGDAARGVLTAAAMATLFVLWRNTSLTVVVTAALSASALTALAAGASLRHRIRTLGPSERLATGLTAIAFPLMVVDLAGLIFNQADLWVIGASRPASDVAVYGACGRVAVLLAVPLFIVNAVVAPMVAELHVKEKHDDLETALRGASTVATGATLLMFVVVVVAGGQILGVIFGSFAERGGSVLTVLALGQVIAVSSGSCTITLMMTGHQRTVMIGSLVAVVFTVPGLIVAAEVSGMLAVAAVSAGGIALQNVILTVWAHRHLGVWTHASLSPRNVRRFRQLLS